MKNLGKRDGFSLFFSRRMRTAKHVRSYINAAIIILEYQIIFEFEIRNNGHSFPQRGVHQESLSVLHVHRIGRPPNQHTNLESFDRAKSHDFGAQSRA